jgi:hypothetical protein
MLQKLEFRYQGVVIEGTSPDDARQLRNHDTESHIRRVAELTLRIARRLGFSEEDLLNLRSGALHDLGNLVPADAILFKPGPLTPAEWEELLSDPPPAKKRASAAHLSPAADGLEPLRSTRSERLQAAGLAIPAGEPTLWSRGQGPVWGIGRRTTTPHRAAAERTVRSGSSRLGRERGTSGRGNGGGPWRA